MQRLYEDSRELGNILLKSLSELDVTDWEKPMESSEVFRISSGYVQYKVALLAELGVAPSFFVSSKAPYDTMMLLDEGETILPAELASKAPEAIFDTREAAKCLAYEAPTAAGFHIMRAAESVVRRYYANVSNGKSPPKVRNLMVYIRTMESAKIGDQKILSALTQISNLHRNPLMHPEDVLTVGEAMALVGIVRSAVSAMLSVLPDVPQTTSTAPGLSQGAP